MALCYDKLSKEVNDRIWYRSTSAFAFLVDAPYTLGHSQLVLKILKPIQEEHIFAKASIHAAKCIETLSTKLRSKLTLQRKEWRQLAIYTETSGCYEKTLVLRVSADEEADTYKVHLVPYFASHLEATGRLYRGTHNKEKGRTGGLLHWLGQREVLVDYDMRHGRSDPIVMGRIDSFNLSQLASFLCGGRVK
jgi:hypothetical protein